MIDGETTYVEDFGAVGDGITDDTVAISNAVAMGQKVVFSKNKNYLISSNIIVPEKTFINLNGSTIQLETALQHPCFNVQGNDVSIQNGTINVIGSTMGGYGGSLACITAGNQTTGEGYNALTFTDLTLSTNRDDAGAAISILGECTNILIENIVIPDNDRIRNVFGFEWGGTPTPEGTGHPHNIKVNNIKAGRLTNVSPLLGGYGYLVWVSAGFNVQVSNIFVEKGFGILCHIQGDNGADYAPARYKDAVGKNVSLKNGTIMECFGYAVRVVGRPSDSSFEAHTSIDGLVAYGDLTEGNDAVGVQTEYSSNTILCNFKISGFHTGFVTGADTRRPLVKNGEVTLCQLSGIALGNSGTKCLEGTVKNVLLHKNNQAGFTGTGVAGILLNNSIRSTVENCTFGVEGEVETQRYAIAGDVTCEYPHLNNNYTHAVSTGGVAYLFGASSQTEINPHGVNNYASPSVTTVYGGCPIFQLDTLGIRRFTSSIVPVVGTYDVGDRVYFSNPQTFLGAVCITAGTPGTWRNFGD